MQDGGRVIAKWPWSLPPRHPWIHTPCSASLQSSLGEVDAIASTLESGPDLLISLGQYSIGEVTVCQIWASRKLMYFFLSFGTLPLPWEQVQASALENERPWEAAINHPSQDPQRVKEYSNINKVPRRAAADQDEWGSPTEPSSNGQNHPVDLKTHENW